jgi:hypothetical protein
MGPVFFRLLLVSVISCGVGVLFAQRTMLNSISVGCFASTSSIIHASAFQKAALLSHSELIADLGNSCGTDRNATCFPRKRVNFTSFPHKGTGGLLDADREVIGELYFNANSVFEFGVGESTAIAAATNVPRYTGVDNDAQWVSNARALAPDRYRFYFADVGETKLWGFPANGSLAKMSYDYQIAPLLTELEPFEVYTVDGRWRVACVMTCFLHAIHTGGNLTTTRVYLHDYSKRKAAYNTVETVATIEKSSGLGVILALKNSATEVDLYNAWEVRVHCKRFSFK